MPRAPSTRPGAAVAIASGLCAGGLLGLASRPGLGPLAFAALAPFLVLVARGAGAARLALAGAALGMAFAAVAGAWVLDVPGSRLAVGAAFGVLLLAAALWMALFGAALAGAGALAGHSAALAAAPAIFVAIELARSSGPLGTPWLLLGSLLAERPAWIQLAALGGAPLLSAWIVAVNAGLAASRARPARLAGVLVAGVGLPVLAGHASLRHDAPASGESLRVAAVQPDVPSERRRAPQHFHAHLNALFAHARRLPGPPPDLIVWPESAFERPFPEGGDPFLGALASSLGAPLLTGARRPRAGRAGLYRTAAVLGRPDGSTHAVSDKVRPVSVYERAPGSRVSQALARAGLWQGRVEPGEAPGLLRLAAAHGDVAVGVLVCVDAAHADLARDLRRRGAQLLVVIANEAETGPTTARQMLAVARLRAVENGVPVVRVANTGPSAWIDARGRLLARIPAGRHGAHAASLRPAAPPASRSAGARGEALALAASLIPPALALGARRTARRLRG